MPEDASKASMADVLAALKKGSQVPGMGGQSPDAELLRRYYTTNEDMAGALNEYIEANRHIDRMRRLPEEQRWNYLRGMAGDQDLDRRAMMLFHDATHPNDLTHDSMKLSSSDAALFFGNNYKGSAVWGTSGSEPSGLKPPSIPEGKSGKTG